MEPSDLIAQLNYVRCLIENFDADVAQRHLDSIAGQFESSKLWNCQIWILTAYRNVRRTLEYIEGLLRKNPLGSASPYVLEDLMLQKLALLVRLNQEDEKHVESRQIDDTFAQLLGIRPMNISIRKQLCDVLIAADRNEEAAIQVDLLPDIPDDQITSLRIWRLHSFGDVAGAKATWEFRRKSMHVPMIQPCDPNTLERVDQLESVERDGEVTLFTAIRNERARLPWFLEYYRRIGVDRFVFVDNRSEDESRTYLQQQPDVHLYIAHETYAQGYSGVRWINDLTQRHARCGWVLYADVDEALIFPGIETTGIRMLTTYMDSHGQEALSGFMLDMFSDSETDPTAIREDIDFIKAYPFFENNYRRFPTKNCPYYFQHGGMRRHFRRVGEHDKDPALSWRPRHHA